MIRRRYLTSLIATVVLSALMAPVTTNSARIQQPSAAIDERDRGIQLYKNGDAKGAVDALRIAVKRQKDDISAWHYLGLALEQKGDKSAARKAHEKAAKLGESMLNQLLDQTPNGQELPRPLLAIRSQLIESAESAERYVALGSKLSASKAEDWNTRIGSLRGFAGLASDQSLKVYSGKEVTTKVRVLSKPEPTYTEEARKNQTTGTVVLRCIFGANGKVFGFRAFAGLPDGLTERAIQAARRIRFIPATKDGHPVSMWMEIEYNFNLY